MAFFTILINTRNSSGKIGRCLSSIKSQNFTDFVAYVNDDASSDDTYNEILDITSGDPRFIVNRNKSCIGAVKNTIVTLDQVTTDSVVVIVDGDDYLYNEYSLRRIYESYTEDPEIEATSWGFVVQYKKEGSEALYLNNYSTAPINPRDVKEWVHAHCRTFKLSLFKKIPPKYFLMYNKKIPHTSVDTIIHYLVVQLAKKVKQLSHPIYVWDISSDTGHDFEYTPMCDEVFDPITYFYRRASVRVANLILTNERLKVLDTDMCIRKTNTQGPLLNSIVFFVGYRNQPTKIKECLESLKIAIQEWDPSRIKDKVGLVLIDDASDDDSFKDLPKILAGSYLDYTLCKNEHRRMYSRNLYNAVHQLSRNPESVIIELNGDDRLVEGSAAIHTIMAEYKKGALRTCGYFETVSEVWDDHTTHMVKYLDDALLDITKKQDLRLFSYWMHPKTYKRSLFTRIPLKYFFEIGTTNWIKSNDDTLLGMVMTNLAGYSKVSIITKKLYVFNMGPGMGRFMSKEFKTYSSDKLYGYLDNIQELDSYNHAIMLQNRKRTFVPYIKERGPSTVPWVSYKHMAALTTKYLFVVFVYNYGSKLWRCLDSIVRTVGDRKDCSVLLYNDCSTDYTTEQLGLYMKGTGIPFNIISNSSNAGKAHNLFVISRLPVIDRDSIVLFIDGDDYLNDEEHSTLDTLDSTYETEGTEATLGSFVLCSDDPVSSRIVGAMTNNQIPCDTSSLGDPQKLWHWAHLKTCKFHLLNKVEDSFFMDAITGSFLKTGDDNFIFPRCLRLATTFKFIKEPLYVYDTSSSSVHDTHDFVISYTELQKQHGLNFMKTPPRYSPKVNHNYTTLKGFVRSLRDTPPVRANDGNNPVVCRAID